jgi:hypothetical protein
MRCPSLDLWTVVILSTMMLLGALKPCVWLGTKGIRKSGMSTVAVASGAVGHGDHVTCNAPSAQRKRTSNVARPKILRPPDFAPMTTTPVRVAGFSDLIRPLNSMSAPAAADTTAGADSRTA